jgi:bifunctional UDP-N-acetylglucosamine pyrophosphorylase/glucosamine-1-phosphate N-acetyltransferase
MRSKVPKVLHPILGKPMLWYALKVAKAVTYMRPVIVIGHGGDEVEEVVGDQARFVIQEQQLGTGHALQQTETLLRDESQLVLVTSADMPLLRERTLNRLVEAQREHDGPMSMITVLADDARGFGRVVRDKDGVVKAIVEEADATPEQLSIRELNAGVYCFSASWLWGALARIPLSPKGEYYLTDLVSIAIEDGHHVRAILAEDSTEMIGVNTRVHLAEASALLRERINRDWMLAGVSIVDPASTYIEPTVTLGQDTVIHPNTHLRGETNVGEICALGPNTIIQDTQIGNGCKVVASNLEGAVLEDDVDVGPFGHLRKGAHLARGVHMGNFGEVKNSYLGVGSKMGHFSYLGDTTIGTNVNIGAGTITCNYDGERKHPTEIESNVFIGSDTMLVAPVKIGRGARTGAGSVVNKDVPEDTLVVGMPARAIRKLKSQESSS